ncbi:alpha-tocopherol transfer protein-like, partial [Tropilaelaps mercedesae]
RFAKRMSELREWEQRAREELNDIAELREIRLGEFRRQMLELETDNFKPLIDDDLLMIFLRSRKFDIERALKTFKAWAVMRTVDPDVFFPLGKGPMNYRHVLELPIFTVMPRVNHDSTTIVVITYKHYDISKFNFLDVITMGSLLCSYLLRDPYIQVHGVRCVVDYSGLQANCLKAVPFKYIKVSVSTIWLIVNVMAIVIGIRDGCPARIRGIHQIHIPGFLQVLLYTIKPLLNRKLSSRTYFHTNMADLYKYIDPEILPEELGGGAGPMKPGKFEESFLANHDAIVQGNYCGYII